jgi:hypothetical protein
MSTKLWLAAATLWGALTASSAQANDIVYSIDQTSTTPEVGGELSPLSDTISGTITTDGTLSVLQSSDILSYNLQLNDNLRPADDVDLTPANSSIDYDTGNGLSASATRLFFDFSDAGAVFSIQATTPGIGSGYHYFCLQATTGPCAAGETIVPDYYAVDGVLATGLSGTLPLNPQSDVPEPATWAMMLLGFAGIWFATYRRARHTTSAAVTVA